MLFDYQKFIEKLSKHEDHSKRLIFEKYRNFYPNSLMNDITDQIWFKEYVVKFDNLGTYKVPPLWKEDFNWELLNQLFAASFSSEVSIFVNEGSLVTVKISVENDGKIITKSIEELYPFQIDRLFEIYIEEQMNLQNHWQENLLDEQVQIDTQRKVRINRWKSQAFDCKSKQEMFNLINT